MSDELSPLPEAMPAVSLPAVRLELPGSGFPFDLDGPLRVERHADGWYLVGQGYLGAALDEGEARGMAASIGRELKRREERGEEA